MIVWKQKQGKTRSKVNAPGISFLHKRVFKLSQNNNNITVLDLMCLMFYFLNIAYIHQKPTDHETHFIIRKINYLNQVMIKHH